MTVLDDEPGLLDPPLPPPPPPSRPRDEGQDADEGPNVGDPSLPTAASGSEEPPLPALRTGLVVACSVSAAAVMAGGLFNGLEGRIYPVVAGICGVVIAAQATMRTSAFWANATILGGIIGVGVIAVIPAGIENLAHIPSILSEAKAASRVMRPPAEFLPGWRLISGLIMAMIGFGAGWAALEFRRPALGLLVPLPAVAYAAISVPEAEKIPSGVVAAVLFIVGLTLLSSLQNAIDGSDGALGVTYELRRAARAAPLVVVLAVLLVMASRSDILFPKPRYDPTRDSVAPKAVPPSEVKDRPLFTVASTATGPWRIGILDVYADDEWRLPAFAESNLQPVPASGVVDSSLQAGVTAEFEIEDLGGAVLPGLPSTVGIRATGPRLAYDERTGNIRLAQGQIRQGLRYTVAAAGLPTEDALRGARIGDGARLPDDVRRALEAPDPPPAVRALLQEAPTDNGWDRVDFVRRRFLANVTAAGPGTPTPVPPSKVDDMLVGSKQGSPFEIVAAQALLARWAGLPARIGYGFDGGEEIGSGLREVRPRHGSSWLELWFPGQKWLPVLGQPAKAKASLQTDAPVQAAEGVEASTEIAVQVYFPLRTKGESPFFAQVRRVLLFAIPLLVVLVLLYFLWPAPWKAFRRHQARRRARAAGIQAEVAQAYAEFRDRCTDLGIPGRSLTPLAFLDMLAADEEHEELAWLVTRVVWGDMRNDRREEHALDAIELATALRKRVSQAQPVVIRLLSSVSRLSVRQPFAPELTVKQGPVVEHTPRVSREEEQPVDGAAA